MVGLMSRIQYACEKLASVKAIAPRFVSGGRFSERRATIVRKSWGINSNFATWGWIAGLSSLEDHAAVVPIVGLRVLTV